MNRKIALTRCKKAQTFGRLIRIIADEFHRGSLRQLAMKVGVANMTVHLWVTGVTKYPRIEHLESLSGTYGLDFDFVRRFFR